MQLGPGRLNQQPADPPKHTHTHAHTNTHSPTDPRGTPNTASLRNLPLRACSCYCFVTRLYHTPSARRRWGGTIGNSTLAGFNLALAVLGCSVEGPVYEVPRKNRKVAELQASTGRILHHLCRERRGNTTSRPRTCVRHPFRSAVSRTGSWIRSSRASRLRVRRSPRPCLARFRAAPFVSCRCHG